MREEKPSGRAQGCAATRTGPDERLITVDDLAWTYFGTEDPTLSDAAFSVEEGECVVVSGPSGCGKTTLTRALNGLIPHFYEGSIEGVSRVCGLEVARCQPHEIATAVGSVFQDPRSQFFATTTTDEVAFGCENLGIPSEEIESRVSRAFQAAGAGSLRDRSIFELSSGQKQKIAIASALAMEPAVLVLDEPSANLDNEAARMLADALGALKQAGCTIVVAEHRLHYLMDVADRVVFMDEGRVTGSMDAREARAMSYADALARKLRLPCLARVPLGAGGDAGARLGEPGLAEAAPRLEMRGVTASYKGEAVLKGIDFELEGPGEVVGIVGENGAGKTTLLRTLCGLKGEDSGEVLIDGAPASAKDRTRSMSFVMQDADYQLFTESVDAELHFARRSSPELEREIGKTLDDLGLTPYRKAHPMTLSGGQKQRLTIACALTSGSRIVLFDEPTSGLDGKTMRTVASLLRAMAQGGRRVLVVTHDFEFIACACDRVLCMKDGVIAETLPVIEESRQKLMGHLGL